MTILFDKSVVFYHDSKGSEKVKLDEMIKSNGHFPDVHDTHNTLLTHVNAAISGDLLAINLSKPKRVVDNKPYKALIYITTEVDEVARCTNEGDYYLITLSYSLICRIALIASRLDEVIICRREKQNFGDEKRADNGSETYQDAELPHDDFLFGLLARSEDINQTDALRVSDSWIPNCKDHGFGTHMVFYDLVRMIVLHELAHCIFGHLEIVENTLGLMSLQEHELNSNQTGLSDKENELLQSIEFEADRIAISSMTAQILVGFDPAWVLFSNADIEIADRLSVLNLSIAIFSSLWDMNEIKKGISALPLAERVSKIIDSTHPPAKLRYANMSEFMLRNSSGIALKFNISDLAINTVEAKDNLNLKMILNQDPLQTVLEVITRQYSTFYIVKMKEVCEYFHQYLAAQGPLRFSRRLDRPINSYNQKLSDSMGIVRYSTLSKIYLSSNQDFFNMQEFYYPTLLVKTSKSESLELEDIYF
ncbi:MAG: hypothetical protein OQK03_04855 [Colwellia sp.]|nr:hypothetical protein [Colwellia sp.]